MAAVLRRTTGLLRAEATRANAGLLWLFMAMIVAWAGWLGYGKMDVYASSQSARVEVAENPFPIQPPEDGVVVSSDLRLGRTVEAGDELFRLDTKPFELQRGE